MTDKLTPAQECAVELYKSHNTPIKRLLYLDSAAILNESGFPVYDVDIISRYIREAEQRGREMSARETIVAIKDNVLSPPAGDRDIGWNECLDAICKHLGTKILTPEAPND